MKWIRESKRTLRNHKDNLKSYCKVLKSQEDVDQLFPKAQEWSKATVLRCCSCNKNLCLGKTALLSLTLAETAIQRTTTIRTDKMTAELSPRYHHLELQIPNHCKKRGKPTFQSLTLTALTIHHHLSNKLMFIYKILQTFKVNRKQRLAGKIMESTITLFTSRVRRKTKVFTERG